MINADEYGAQPATAADSKFVWAGRILSWLAIAFFVFDGAMKLVQPQPVIDATKGIGWPTDGMTLAALGVVLLACTAFYAVPRTAVLGAILLTGYLGGAVVWATRCLRMTFSASTWVSSYGAGSGFATNGCGR